LLIATCSTCINTSVLDSWCFGDYNAQPEDEEISSLGLDAKRVLAIHEWSQTMLASGKLEFGNIFPNLSLALDFKEVFYPNREDIELFGLSLSGSDVELFLEQFAPGCNSEFNYNNGEFALRKQLLKKNPVLADSNSVFLGYDLIGMEGSGNFHSFHCHGIFRDLTKLFGLTLNEHGLFDHVIDQEAVRNYMNGHEASVEPVPWYIAKVNKISR